ncbi:HK97 family phage prohead protease [Mycolicibacterium sp. S2-37]|uniref:HK97 family phage prohead protease n=1 Tax=Mycolicibacterium sp. S2-37 TaxID=2810297 RepID=UPI001A94A3F7|nr:HK97 family phage prohead protease [Mycolicibacterium sp. S2-37]MBO0676799.1 HK97 family phage prohead protease [Mycolicibacterium sp. S2-37]
MTRRNRPVTLTDAPEHRNIPLDRVELRDVEDDDTEIVLEGYASTFEEYDMYGGPEQYGWIERIDPGAFEKTLREKPDLHLLINHAGMPLARTKSGTLDLSVDDHGLKVTARLDTRDPEVQSLRVKMGRGDMDEMSFAFRVKAQEWRAAPGFEEIDDQSYRTITEVSLHKGDVSVVNWGANPTTSAGIRSAADALAVLANADEDELAEVRSDADLVMRAAEKLGVAPGGQTYSPPTVMTVQNMHVGEGLDAGKQLARSMAAIAGEPIEAEEGVVELSVEQLTEAIGDAGILIEALRSVGILEAMYGVPFIGTALAAVAELVAIDLPDEARDEEEVEDDVEERDEEETDEVEPVFTLSDALAAQGILTEDGPLSLDAALALS